MEILEFFLLYMTYEAFSWTNSIYNTQEKFFETKVAAGRSYLMDNFSQSLLSNSSKMSRLIKTIDGKYRRYPC